MGSDKELIEPADLQRLKRLSRAASALLETGYNNQLVKEALARLDQYKDRFLTLSRVVTECDSQHRAQLQSVQDLVARLEQNKNEQAETQRKMKKAVLKESDVDTIALLNARLPAIQLAIDNLQIKLGEARQQLATRWQVLEGALGQVLDIRRLLDNDSSELEGLVRIVVANSDPALEEIRARHRDLISGGTKLPAPSPAQPEPKVIHLTRRTDELPIHTSS